MRTYLLTLCLFVVASSLRAAPVIKQRDHMHGARYGEIIVVTGGPVNFTGHVYNTIGLNDCPEDAWKALKPADLKKEWKARAVILNGPRYFLMDQSVITDPGDVVSFDGLQARFLATLTIPLANVLHGEAPPYTENTVMRSTEYFFKKGRTIYELISPQGSTYVMQSYSQTVDPKLTEADLSTLESRLALPPGWRYQIRTLDADYSMKTTGIAYVLQDNLKNSYQKQ